MSLEILLFEERYCPLKLGYVFVRYHDLVMRCELVYQARDKAAWLRMPEYQIGDSFKHVLCHWVSRDLYDKFQNLVLIKLFDKYDLSTEKIAEMYKKHADEYRKKNPS